MENSPRPGYKESISSFDMDRLTHLTHAIRDQIRHTDQQISELQNARERLEEEYRIAVNVWVDKRNEADREH